MTASRSAAADGLLLHGHDEVPDSLGAAAARLQRDHGVVLARPAAPFLSDEPGAGRAWWRAHEDGPGPDTLGELLALLDPPPSRRAPQQPLPPQHQRALQPAEGPERGVLIAGFSQGAAVAAALAAMTVREHSPRSMRVVLVAGFLPGPLEVPAASAADDLRMLVITGEQDTVVDPFHGELLARRFRRQGWAVVEASHPGGHWWDDAVTDLAATWLAHHPTPAERSS